MTRTLIALLAAGLLAGCGSSDDSEPAADAEQQETPAAQPADPWPKRLKVWEKENAIQTSEWFDVVRKREVQLDVLWVETTLPNDAEAESVANAVCGAYSTIVMDYPKVDVVTVRAGDGNELYRCGLGA